MPELSPYPKIFHAGHRNLRDLLLDPVVIEEKIDGSQISFGVMDGGLFARSKGVALDLENPDKMFSKAVETIKSLRNQLVPGWTCRGEYLRSNTHNTLVYDRTPAKNIILFDIMTNVEDYLDRAALEEAAEAVGLEVVPLYFEGALAHIDDAKQYLGRTSCLGGAPAEGVVVKSRTRFGADGKPLLCKLVTELFRELHVGARRKENPTPADIRADIAARVCTPARWEKAVQRLRDSGRLKEDPSDIGALMKEVNVDLEEEVLGEITDLLLEWALKDIKREAVAGLPAWYKEKLSNPDKGPTATVDSASPGTTATP